MNPILQMEYLAVAAAVLLGISGFCAWRSSRKARPYVRVIITATRVLGILCLVVIAANPGRWDEKREEKDSEWVIMLDRTLSMSAADVDGRTRWEEALRLAEKTRAYARRPEKATLLTFSDSVEQAGDPLITEMKPDGRTTDILQSGAALLNRFRSAKKDLTGIILISDGRQIRTSGRSDLAIRARAQESPFFALCLGGPVERKDLSVTAAQSRLVAFAGQKTRITARIENKGLGNISATLQLLDPARKVISSETVRIPDGRTASVSFEVAPPERGYYEYTVKSPPWENESILSNNEVGIGISVLGSKMRILTIEGVPYWDSKFLAQLLRKQPNTEVTSIYRVSSQRFFKVETDTATASESGQPIFPDDEQAMGMYDLVVFGKGVEYFLTPERIRLLRDFVRNQGGCVVFGRSKPYSGTFPALEPLEPVSWGDPISTQFRFKPTEAGEDAGLFGAMLPKRDDPLWDRLPTLNNAHRCPGLKSFSGVLAEGVFESAEKKRGFPLIVSRRYGKGVVIAFNADGLWQWDFFPSIKEAGNMYAELWTQFFQWAATYSEFLPGQEFSMRLSENRVFPDSPVRIRISRRGTARETDAPQLRVVLADKPIQEIAAVRTPGTDRNWDAILSLGEPGTYRLELADAANPDFHGPCIPLHIAPLPTEHDDFSADPEFLKRLAEESGGTAIVEEDLEKVVHSLEHETETVDLAKATWKPLWDRWWCLCLTLAFFGTECFFRRRNGLL